MGAFRDAIWGAKNGDSKAVELLYDQFSPLLLKCSIPPSRKSAAHAKPDKMTIRPHVNANTLRLLPSV